MKACASPATSLGLLPARSHALCRQPGSGSLGSSVARRTPPGFTSWQNRQHRSHAANRDDRDSPAAGACYARISRAPGCSPIPRWVTKFGAFSGFTARSRSAGLIMGTRYGRLFPGIDPHQLINAADGYNDRARTGSPAENLTRQIHGWPNRSPPAPSSDNLADAYHWR